MLTLTTVESPADIAAARELLREYVAWVLTVETYARDAPTFQELDEELAALPGPYAPPRGRLLIARDDGVPAGCVALKPHPSGAGELKRMYVRPAQRGRGVARRLVGALMDAARALGYDRLVLDSHISMTDAHALYRGTGFRPMATPEDFPANLRDSVVFMVCDLRSPQIADVR